MENMEEMTGKKNYVIFHLHSDFSLLDSATKFDVYVDKAVELGMKSICFSEHGNFFNWVKKKQYCDSVGIKYIHGQEFYVTESIDNKVRDNWHIVLIAKNLDGVKELNRMSSVAYQKDGHFYYNPRITLQELFNTSDNIIVSTACLGGILNSDDEEVKDKFIDFISNNKERCFLEIQHHNDSNRKQAEYNKYLFNLSNKLSLRLWTGTDTHSLNNELADVRGILQKSKNINFTDEDDWDLTFKNYDELVECYRVQNALPKVVYLEAIENTNILNDTVEDFDLDLSYKYPKIYNNPEEIFRSKINNGLLKKGLENNKKYIDRVEYEIKAIAKNGAIDYLLLQEKIASWARSKGIFSGPSRGSVSGSICAYLLGITEVDSIKFNMNFDRFMNSERVSLSDIDIDYPPNRREEVKNYVINNLNLNCCDIITFNTVATKGAIRDVSRAMSIPLETVNEICKNVEYNKKYYEEKYPDIFKYSNLLEGVITSVGVHPCGVVTSDLDIEEYFGTFTMSKNSYPISQIDMKNIDSLNFVKLDILGLDNVQLINETCKLANIERLMPDNINFDDKNVWNDILNNSIGIFQWESSFAHHIYKELFKEETLGKIKNVVGKIDYLSLLSMANGAIRPAGESYRNRMCNGEFNDNGHESLNKMLEPTMGYCVYQEQIIEFLNKFCGYSMGMSDVVRRGFAKKVGTDKFIPKIKSGFIKTMKDKYNVEKKESEKIIKSFLTVIEDASEYLFSSNHSYPYSMIGYTCAYLRYYYKLEFLTSMLNINNNNIDKSSEIIKYTESCNIKVFSPKFRNSKSLYFFNKENNSIYKGTSSVKFVSTSVGNELFEMGKLEFDGFLDFLIYVEENSHINSRQLETLIQINYFEEFGSNQTLFKFFHEFTKGKARYSRKHTDKTKAKRIDLLQDFWKLLPDEKLPIWEQLGVERDILGYIYAIYPHINKRFIYVMNLNEKFAPRIQAYCLNNGNQSSLKIQKRVFKNNNFLAGDILYVKHFAEKPSVSFVDGEFVESETETTWWIDSYNILTPEEFDEVVSRVK